VIFVLLFAMVAAGTAFGAAQAEGTADDGIQADVVVPIEGSISLWGGGHLTNTTEAVMADFLEANPALDVAFEKYPFTEYPVKMRLALGAGDSDPDIMIIHNHWIREFIEAGWLADLSAVLPTDELTTEVLHAVSGSNGEVYGVPFETESISFYYRQDVFDELGLEPPTTLQEYIEVGQVLRDNGYWAGSYDTNTGDNNRFTRWLAASGGDYYNEEYEVILDTPEGKGVQTLEAIAELVDAGILWNGAVWSQEYWSLVNEGQIAANMGGNYAAKYHEWNMDPEGDGGYGSWRQTLPPRLLDSSPVTGRPGGTFMVISANSENKQLAWEIIKYLKLTIEGSRKYAEVDNVLDGYLPGLRSLAEDSRAWELFGGQRVSSDTAEIMLEHRPKLLYSASGIWEAYSTTENEIARFFAGELSADEAMANAADRMR
jgi:multiple sugar transport system substrate-binding protein